MEAILERFARQNDYSSSFAKLVKTTMSCTTLDQLDSCIDWSKILLKYVDVKEKSTYNGVVLAKILELADGT